MSEVLVGEEVVKGAVSVLDAWRDNGVRSASRRKGGHGGRPGCYKLGETTVGEVLVAK